MSVFGKSKLKYYKGSSKDTQWNHDILWKARVKAENSLLGIKAHQNVPSHYQQNEGPSTTYGGAPAKWLSKADQAKLQELNELLAIEKEKSRALQKKLDNLLNIVLKKERQHARLQSNKKNPLRNNPKPSPKRGSGREHARQQRETPRYDKDWSDNF